MFFYDKNVGFLNIINRLNKLVFMTTLKDGHFIKFYVNINNSYNILQNN